MNTFEEVYEQFEPMIYHMIRKLIIRQDHDIYFQEGSLELWRVWERFDDEQGPFAPYAYQFIRGGMLTYMRSDNRIKEKENVRSEEFWQMKETGELDQPFQKHLLDEYTKHLTPAQQAWLRL